MRASTKNLIRGTFHKIKGSAKTAMGRLALSGRVERAGGIVRVTFGRTQRLLGL